MSSHILYALTLSVTIIVVAVPEGLYLLWWWYVKQMYFNIKYNNKIL